MCQVTCLVGFFLAYSLIELEGRSSWSTNIKSEIDEKHQQLTNSKETNVHDLEPADGDWGLVGRFCSGVLHLRGVQGSCWLCDCWGWGGQEEGFSLKCKEFGFNSVTNLKRCCCRRRALSWVWSLLDRVSGPWLAFFAGKTPCKIKFTYDAV